MKRKISELVNKYNYVKYFMDNLLDEENFEIIY